MSRSSSNSVSVYDGRQFRGAVRRHGDGYVAISPAGEGIGKFQTRDEAAGALEEETAS